MKHVTLLLILAVTFSCANKKNYKQITASEFENKMKAAWIGQMAGVGWGLPTEFDYIDEMIPSEDVPQWRPEMINQQGNDDLYVEMTFLASMKKYGIDVSQRQAGIDFANTGYSLWAANKAGRENLRFGIAPPESSHPHYNVNCEDIDYQIEADYSGIIAPGMPNVPIELGEKFGRLMNYGDGMYGGQFVGGMYAAAYFTDDIEEIILAGLDCIPEQSNYAKVVKDVMNWHKENPDSWESCWKMIMDKYYRTLDHQPFHKQNPGAWVGIDAKTNGAFIVLGLLYGEGDMDKTIRYSMQCGLDSDCNPSNAAGILATTIGYEKLDDKFKSGLDWEKKFSYTELNFNDLVDVSSDFARQFIVKRGGEIAVNNEGEEYFMIKNEEPLPSVFRPAYDPDDFNPENRFSPEEFAEIKAYSSIHYEKTMEEIASGWNVFNAGKASKVETIKFHGEENVLQISPMSTERSALIEFSGKQLDVKDGSVGKNTGKTGEAMLAFHVNAAPEQPWKLTVDMNSADGRINKAETISSPSNQEWKKIEIPFSFKGNNLPRIRIGIHSADGEALHYAYISDLVIKVLD